MGIKIAGRNINNLRHTDDTTLTAESKEELRSLLRKIKEESENADLKLNINKMWPAGQISKVWVVFLAGQKP